MHRRIANLATLFICGAALACAGLVQPAAADGTTSVTTPIDFTATACNGETVTLSGEATTLITVSDTSGGRGVTTHIHFHLEGTSASGTHYIVNETVNGADLGAGDIPATFNSTGSLHLISQGGGENLTVRTTIHTTINANGDVTAQSFEFQTVCNG
ncbi:MAG TPA: hypothetical protein VF525_04755 [Pyrinomonadaceae bacterium]